MVLSIITTKTKTQSQTQTQKICKNHLIDTMIEAKIEWDVELKSVWRGTVGCEVAWLQGYYDKFLNAG